jgi:hypothetical protein
MIFDHPLPFPPPFLTDGEENRFSALNFRGRRLASLSACTGVFGYAFATGRTFVWTQ